jgi:hypothetical protein
MPVTNRLVSWRQCQYTRTKVILTFRREYTPNWLERVILRRKPKTSDREFIGSGTVWLDRKTGRRCSTPMESYLSDVYDDLRSKGKLS